MQKAVYILVAFCVVATAASSESREHNLRQYRRVFGHDPPPPPDPIYPDPNLSRMGLEREKQWSQYLVKLTSQMLASDVEHRDELEKLSREQKMRLKLIQERIDNRKYLY